MKQFYEVGECVTLNSRSMPQYNGEYIIHDIHPPMTREECKVRWVKVAGQLTTATHTPLGLVLTGEMVSMNSGKSQRYAKSINLACFLSAICSTP